MTRPILSQDVCKLLNTVITEYDWNHFNPSQLNSGFLDDSLKKTRAFQETQVKLWLPHFLPDRQRQVCLFLNNPNPYVTLPDINIAPTQAPIIPREIKVRILDQAENMAHFILLSRVFNRFAEKDDDGQDTKAIAEIGAQNLLKVLNYPYNKKKFASALEQLFSHIFLDTYSKASEQRKNELSSLVLSLNKFEVPSNKWLILRIKLLRIVISFLKKTVAYKYGPILLWICITRSLALMIKYIFKIRNLDILFLEKQSFAHLTVFLVNKQLFKFLPQPVNLKTAEELIVHVAVIPWSAMMIYLFDKGILVRFLKHQKNVLRNLLHMRKELRISNIWMKCIQNLMFSKV